MTNNCCCCNDKLDLLLQKIERIEKDCNRMDKHISFIESIYETLKKPIHYIAYAFNYHKIQNKYIGFK